MEGRPVNPSFGPHRNGVCGRLDGVFSPAASNRPYNQTVTQQIAHRDWCGRYFYYPYYVSSRT